MPSDLVFSSSSLSVGFFSWVVKSFDSIYSAQEKKPADKLDEENTKSEGVREFFLVKEKESEENKE